MDFADQINALAARIPKQTEHLQTEAATSTSLVMPFIAALGYNVFDPTEVVPEYTADVGTKKGEKVDYAILKAGRPVMLFEVKCWNTNLSEVHASQLYRYFTVTEARFGILTNGIQYKFFTDLEEPNKMDEKPFFEFDMTGLRPEAVNALKDFTRSKFDMDTLITCAGELKYTKGIVRALASEYQAPSEEFVKLLAKQVHSGNLTKQVREQFVDIVRRAFHQFVNERLNERLSSALARSDADSGDLSADSAEAASTTAPPDGVVAVDGDVVTTEEEQEGFHIVRAIMAEVVAPERIVMRDTKSYCGILLDDNNRKPICRLRFNYSKKYIGLFGEEKKEEKIQLESIPDIYKHASRLKATVAFYERD